MSRPGALDRENGRRGARAGRGVTGSKAILSGVNNGARKIRLLPVLSRVYCGKFLAGLTKLQASGALTLPAALAEADRFQAWRTGLYHKDRVRTALRAAPPPHRRRQRRRTVRDRLRAGGQVVPSHTVVLVKTAPAWVRGARRADIYPPAAVVRGHCQHMLASHEGGPHPPLVLTLVPSRFTLTF
jgi:hypothetical protein